MEKVMKQGKQKKKRIAVVTFMNCLRNIKSSVGAWNLGYELELITQYQGFALVKEMGFMHMYKSIRIWDNPNQLEQYMRESDADVLWCHNEPDMMAELAAIPSVKRDRMIIHDCHDLPTLHSELRTSKDTANLSEFERQERAAIMGADFIFSPTQDYVGMIAKKYGDKAGGKVKVVYSTPPEIFFPDTDLPRVNGLLYCGQVNTPDMKSRLPYRNMLPLFSMLTSMGIPTFIYHTHPAANTMSYGNAGALVCGTMIMFAAIHQYTRFNYGYVGSVMDTPEIQCCMPNKLFDCMAAGIPLICQNATTAGKFITDNGIGLAVSGMEALATVPWGDKDFWEGCRKKVREIRHEYTAEKTVAKAFREIGI